MIFRIRISESKSIPYVGQYFIYKVNIFKIIAINPKEMLIQYAWYDEYAKKIMTSNAGMSIDTWKEAIINKEYCIDNIDKKSIPEDLYYFNQKYVTV